MKRKHVYIAIAIGLGALLAWWSKRSSAPAKAATGSLSLGDTFSVGSSSYSTPADLLSPETVIVN